MYNTKETEFGSMHLAIIEEFKYPCESTPFWPNHLHLENYATMGDASRRGRL